MSANFDIQHIAKLARIRLTDSESERLGQQLDTVLEYIDHLGALNTDGVEPTSHVLDVKNVFREDAPAGRLAQKDFLAQAPSSDQGHYEVPKII